MIGSVITVPSFATTKDGVDHFFGTKRSQIGATPGASSDLTNSRGVRRARLISVKQVHGTDVLIVDRPVREGQSFDGPDALMTNQPGIMVTDARPTVCRYCFTTRSGASSLRCMQAGEKLSPALCRMLSRL